MQKPPEDPTPTNRRLLAYLPAYRVALVRDGSVRLEDRPAVGAAPIAARAVISTRIAVDDGIEHFGILLLNVRHRIIGSVEISTGCLTSSLVHPREVFGPPIVHKAAAILLFHNHPSGEPEPSGEDLIVTRRLAAAGKILRIEVLDHIIVGDGSWRWVSFKDRGVL